MNKITCMLIVLIGSWAICQAQETTVPEGWKVIDSISGNLDNNAINEKVVIYNTIDSTDFGKHREIRIFKKEKENWVLWECSRTPLLKSDDGGMMGDPFGGIEIKNRVLLIHHSGGSSWKWSYTDKYRFQNGQFELIGYTSLNGKPCEEWTTIDFNISNGQINFKHEYEDCENEEQIITKTEKETFYKKGITLTLEHRRLNEIEIISPKLKQKFSL